MLYLSDLLIMFNCVLWWTTSAENNSNECKKMTDIKLGKIGGMLVHFRVDISSYRYCVYEGALNDLDRQDV